ncbi:beta-xylosidase 2 [Euphorbia peplus]|nr:beta-xylosidase 2 [Euphorbia peplus]
MIDAPNVADLLLLGTCLGHGPPFSNSLVTLQDLADTYQSPFQSCIQERKASGIMSAYNQVNGVPNCADYNLLSRTARGKWSFNGYITSDCDAVSIIYDTQGYAKTPEDAAADVLKAGMDVNCGNYLKNYTKSAMQKKKVSVADIDRALHYHVCLLCLHIYELFYSFAIH